MKKLLVLGIVFMLLIGSAAFVSAGLFQNLKTTMGFGEQTGDSGGGTSGGGEAAAGILGGGNAHNRGQSPITPNARNNGGVDHGGNTGRLNNGEGLGVQKPEGLPVIYECDDTDGGRVYNIGGFASGNLRRAKTRFLMSGSKSVGQMRTLPGGGSSTTPTGLQSGGASGSSSGSTGSHTAPSGLADLLSGRAVTQTINTYYDACQDENTLIEYYCSPWTGLIKFVIVKCPNGCVRDDDGLGHCISPPYCIDIDRADNQYFKGHVFIQKDNIPSNDQRQNKVLSELVADNSIDIFSDYCVGETGTKDLKQVSCSPTGDALVETTSQCANSCLDGKCTLESGTTRPLLTAEPLSGAPAQESHSTQITPVTTFDLTAGASSRSIDGIAVKISTDGKLVQDFQVNPGNTMSGIVFEDLASSSPNVDLGGSKMGGIAGFRLSSSSSGDSSSTETASSTTSTNYEPTSSSSSTKIRTISTSSNLMSILGRWWSR